MIKKMKKVLQVAGLVMLGAVAVHADGTDVMSELQTGAMSLITSAVAAVTAIVVAGFALVGIMWGARKIKAGIKSA